MQGPLGGQAAFSSMISLDVCRSLAVCDTGKFG